jgi:hypothetical protein
VEVINAPEGVFDQFLHMSALLIEIFISAGKKNFQRRRNRITLGPMRIHRRPLKARAVLGQSTGQDL